MRIRRYYAHDCDSCQGFNNGYYVDDPEGVEVKDIDEAIRLAKKIIQENVDTRYGIEAINNTDGHVYECVTGYFDDDGNEISKKKFERLNDDAEVGSWSYVYCSFDILEE